MSRAWVGAVAMILWVLAIALALEEGWAAAWVVVGFGFGWYWSRVEVRATAEIRRRDQIVARREWRSR